MRIRFITSTPLEISRGSGTYVGITTLARALQAQGAEVEFVTSSVRLPHYTLQRWLFNRTLRFRSFAPVDITVGFDMDGYTLSGRGSELHVASIKGVIADEMRFESGLTHATMRVQAGCERIHVRTADAVITTSQYSARRIQELYGLQDRPEIVPELIDLDAWNRWLRGNAGAPRVEAALGDIRKSDGDRFIVLTVCRFYPRKRLNVLLHAAARLRDRIPGLALRIVGGGPEYARLTRLCAEEKLNDIVTWRENISQAELIAEYQRCDVFCLPSVQEGFGIVFLEAMASGKPIIAARASAVPEVLPQGLLVDPENDEALAAAIERLYREPALRESLAAAGLQRVKQFDSPRVVALFLNTLEPLLAKKQTLSNSSRRT